MVTGDQELQWAYLLCPTFELSNSEGKPLTNGYIELYIAGTRDKYYAASDFAGTLHPFQIPLDSLGSNIVLVSPDNAYDIYVYNRFGNLVMSRYNVVPTNGAAGGGSSSSNISIESGDGTVVVTESTDPETGVKTFDLSVPSVSGNPSFWTGRGAANMGVTISDTEYHKIDISEHSIRNRNDDITVVNGEFNLKKGVYFWNVTVQLDKYEGHDNTRQRVFIESGYNRGAYTMDMTHDETETISFSGITVADYDDTKQDIKIKSEGESPFKAVLYNVSIHKLNQNILGDSSGGHTYLPGDYIEITEDDVINVTGLTTPEDVEAMIDAAITAVVSGDMYTGGDYINIDNHVISVTGLQPEGDYLTQEDLEGYATETYVDNSVSSFTTHTEVYNATVTAIEVATGAIPDTEEVDFEELDITQFAQASAIPVVTGFATRDEVYEAVVTGVQLATAQIPDQLEAGNYIDITNNIINVTGLQPAGEYLTAEDLEGYATEEYVTTYVDNSVSSFVTEEQVTAMFPETEDVTFKELDITQFAQASAIPDLDGYATEEYVTTYVDNSVSSFATHTEVYDATVTAIEAATAAIPDSEEVEFEEINLEDYALASAIPDVSDFATHTEVYESTVTAIEHVTALIPEAQVQSDWTEADTEDPSYIQHKPEEVRLVAGDNINITETATSVVISAGGSTYTAGDYIDITNDTISVTGLDNSNTFFATVGSTSWQTVKDAYDAGKRIFAVTSGKSILPLAEYYSSRFYFSSTVRRTGITNTSPSYIAYTLYNDNSWVDRSSDLQANWNQTDNSAASYIRNKPSIPTVQLNGDNQVTAIDNHTLVGKEYTAGANIYIDGNEIGVTDVIDIYARPESASGMIKLGNIAHWGNIDYGPGLYLRSTMDSDFDHRTFRWYITGDHGIENRFWGAYDDSRPDMGVSGESFLEIREGDIYYRRGEYQSTSTVPIIWSCSGMRYDIDRLQEAVTAIPAAQVQSNWNETNTSSPAYIQNKPTIPAAQVQSNWTEADTADPSYIQNKPTEKFLVGGDNVTITETATSVVISSQGGGSTYTAGQYISIDANNEISVTGLQVAGNYATQADVYDATVTGVQAATGLIPDSEEVDFEELDITQFALASAIPVVTGFATKSELSDVEAAIPTVQLNGDDQVTSINNHEIAGTGGTTYTAGEYISIENDEISVTGLEPLPEIVEMDALEIKAGTNIGIVKGVSDITISVTGIEIPDTSDMATKTWVGNQGYLTEIPNTYATDIEVSQAIASSVTGFLTEPQVTALIPDSEEVDFEEISLSDYALASAIPEAVSGKQDMLTGITDVQVVTGLPVSPTQDVLYLIVEA